MGSLFQGWLCDVVGRKKAFAVAGACSLVGGALITSSVVIEMLIVVRVLHGFGLGMLICLVPLYLTEVAPPRRRGLLSGLTTASFGAGYLVYVSPACPIPPNEQTYVNGVPTAVGGSRWAPFTARLITSKSGSPWRCLWLDR